MGAARGHARSGSSPLWLFLGLVFVASLGLLSMQVIRANPHRFSVIGNSDHAHSLLLEAYQQPAAMVFGHVEPHEWQSVAHCDSAAAKSHLQLMEKLIEPRAVLEQLVHEHNQTWVQIGANTMDQHNANDPLKKLLDHVPSWRKLFVEPIPQLYAKLEQSIKRWPNSQALNVAVSADANVPEAKSTMWCLESAFNSSRLGNELPRWANQICSFNASHIGRHFKGKHGVPVDVTALNLQTMFERAGIDDIKVLIIDTEGFDFQVLKQIPFNRMRPTFILWEHKHLHASRPLAEAFMRHHCYAVWTLDMENTVGVASFV